LRWIGARLALLSRASGAALALAWAGLIWILSSQVIDAVPSGGLWAFASNAGHVVLFGLLALWLALALPRVPRDALIARSARSPTPGWPELTRKNSLRVVLAVALYGALDEWHQSFTGRSPSFFDWVTDVVAATWVVLVAAHVALPTSTRTTTSVRFAAGLAAALGAAALATWA
jgi:hypothetical protein